MTGPQVPRTRRQHDRLKFEVNVAEPYFERIRGLIGSSPARYEMQVVVFCGEWPYLADSLSLLLPPSCRWYEQDTVPPEAHAHTVVVGFSGASRETMSRLLLKAHRSRVALPRFIPQEGFLDEILFGRDWWAGSRNLLNAALEYHPGLQVAHELHLRQVAFPWPSTEAPETIDDTTSQGEGFSTETALHRLGYRITGLTRATRWRVLTGVAIPDLGLQVVVETIANHVRLRKSQRDGRARFHHAIAEWEHDLARLKYEFWSKLVYRFPWPSVEPDQSERD